MNTDNYSLLQDLYLLVTATDILNENKRRELIKFLDVQIQIEEDVMYEPDPEAKYMDTFLKKTFDIDDLHDPEFKLRSHLNG